jgi:hypothetical protein
MKEARQSLWEVVVTRIKKDMATKPRWMRCYIVGVFLASFLVSLFNYFFVYNNRLP